MQEVLKLGALEGVIEVMAVSKNSAVDLSGILASLWCVILEKRDLIEVAKHSQLPQERRVLDVDHADVTLIIISLLLR